MVNEILAVDSFLMALLHIHATVGSEEFRWSRLKWAPLHDWLVSLLDSNDDMALLFRYKRLL